MSGAFARNKDRTPAPPKRINSPRRILIIRDGRVGDMLMMTPVVRWLADRYPGARMDVLAGPYGRAMLACHPAIGEVIVYDKGASALARLGIVARLWHRYDLAVVLESTSSYVVLSWLIGAKYRIGISGRMNALLNYRYKWNHDLHTILNNLNVLAPLMAGVGSATTEMELHLTENDTAAAGRFLDTHGVGGDDRVVFIQPGCGPNELLRPWPPDRVAGLADMVVEKLGAKVIFNAGPNEWETVDRVARLSTGGIIVNDTDLRTTAALIGRASAVVTPDTGTLHVARALGTPVVALFGPSSPANYGPIGDKGRSTTVDKRFPCSPCVFSPPSPQRMKCLAQGGADCMQAIPVDEVFACLAKAMLGDEDAQEG
ncbi:MAG: glycosyltransferase family 9 protein [Candidatus Krumholzibacteriia bacterium]